MGRFRKMAVVCVCLSIEKLNMNDKKVGLLVYWLILRGVKCPVEALWKYLHPFNFSTDFPQTSEYFIGILWDKQTKLKLCMSEKCELFSASLNHITQAGQSYKTACRVSPTASYARRAPGSPSLVARQQVVYLLFFTGWNGWKNC